MKILFAASLHHPQQLIEAIASTPSGKRKPLFPPSMAQHHFELALRAGGHELDVFYRNISGFANGDIAKLRAQKHSQTITPQKVIQALANRLPPHINPDKRTRNANLLAQAQHFQPDVLWLVGDNTVIYPETLQRIKQETGCVLVYASGTSPIVFSHKIERDAARLYDLVIVNDFYHGMQWRELGAQRAEPLPIGAVSPEFHHPYELTDEERAEYTCDIAFVGTIVPDHLYSRRVQALEALRNFDLGIWSVHDVPASLKSHYRGGALGEKMLRIMSAAKLTVNIHGDFMLWGGNIRMFEAAGVGVCQIVDNVPAAREWFTPDENILTFKTLDDLREQVSDLLQNDHKRAQIATSAREHVYAHHSYTQRVQRFEQLISEIQQGTYVQ